MTFRPDSRTDSVVITLLDDDLNEGLEEFTLQLVLTDEQLGMPDVLRESTVRIFDDEGVYVQARVHDLQVACINSMVCISDIVHVVLLVVIFWYICVSRKACDFRTHVWLQRMHEISCLHAPALYKNEEIRYRVVTNSGSNYLYMPHVLQ